MGVAARRCPLLRAGMAPAEPWPEPRRHREQTAHRQVLAAVVLSCALVLAVVAIAQKPAPKSAVLLSEWDIDSDLTPAAIAERRHPFSATNEKKAVRNGVPLALSPSEK